MPEDYFSLCPLGSLIFHSQAVHCFGFNYLHYDSDSQIFNL